MESRKDDSAKSLQPRSEQVLRMRYHDMTKLEEGLNKIYGEGQYKLKACKQMLCV
jgi:hypothetical protein